MDSKFLLLSFVFIFSALFIIGGVFAVDNETSLSYDNGQIDYSPLEISQEYAPNSVNRGELFDVYLTVRNTGLDTYHNITIPYNLPKGLDLIIWSEEYYNNSEWTIDTLYPKESNTLTLVCLPLYSNHSYDFKATMDSKTDSMSVLSNPLADLSVSVDYIVGDGLITWIVNVVNNGPDHAVNAFVSNLPADLGILSSNLTKGSLINDQWIIGDMANGEVQTLILVTNFMDGFEYHIKVASDTVDDVLSNNYASGIVNSTNGGDIQPYSEILDSQATANPIVLLLIAAIFVPVLRFKKD